MTAAAPVVVAVVLAAGRGRRAGGPKALAAWGDGEALLVAHARAAREAGCERVAGVVRADVASALEGAMPEGAGLVVSTADDALGPAGSLAAFVASGGCADGALVAVAPVDVPPAAWRALGALRDAVASAPRVMVARPRVAGRGGHPVLVRAEVLQRAYASEGSARPLREVFAALGEGAVVDVAVDEPAVTGDMDTADELARWRRGA